MQTIHLNGAPGPLADAPIGLPVALTEAGGFAGAASVLWELTRPPGSAAVLATPGPIGAWPFTNSFTPDVPGGYRVRLVVTLLTGAIETATSAVYVLDPYVLAPGAMPAPLEEFEVNASTGWADEANAFLRDGRLGLSGAQWVTVVNKTGAPLPAQALVRLDDVALWPEETGSGTGVVVPAAPIDTLPKARLAAGVWRNVGLVVTAIPSGARGRVLRRGLVVTDTSAWTAGQTLYAIASLLTTPETRAPVAVVLRAALATANPPGLLWFDPTRAELLQDLGGGWTSVTLADNTAALTLVSSAFVWPTATTRGVHIRGTISRGADSEVFSFAGAWVAASATDMVDRSCTPGANSGITLRAVINGANAELQYASTATGNAATLRITHVEVS